MGSPTSKADCDKAIARELKEIENCKAEIARTRGGLGNPGWKKMHIASCQVRISEHKKRIADLKLHKKTLKS